MIFCIFIIILKIFIELLENRSRVIPTPIFASENNVFSDTDVELILWLLFNFQSDTLF